MRFSKYVFTFLFIFVLGSSAFIFKLVVPKESDYVAYQKLIENEDSNQISKTSSPYKAKQERQALQKDILFTQKNERLQIRLISEKGELVLDHRDDQTELVEHMNNVRCYMQEEIFYILPDGREALRQEDNRLLVKHADPHHPASWSSLEEDGIKPMQRIRFLEAETASYNYENKLFSAENVKISRYVVAGHWLSEFDSSLKPLMSGIAKKVQFTLAGKEFNFKAYQLKATIYPLKGSP